MNKFWKRDRAEDKVRKAPKKLFHPDNLSELPNMISSDWKNLELTARQKSVS